MVLTDGRAVSRAVHDVTSPTVGGYVSDEKFLRPR
jgi:hypothetical protein